MKLRFDVDQKRKPCSQIERSSACIREPMSASSASASDTAWTSPASRDLPSAEGVALSTPGRAFDALERLHLDPLVRAGDVDEALAVLR